MTMGSRTSPEDGLLSLKWNNHRSTFLHILTGLRDKPLHSDVTLACSGELFPVHKLVLSSCSTYFASMFASTHCQHPIIVLKDIHKNELEALLDYMYIGEVDVKQSALEPLIRAAECLHIKGLAAPDEELPPTRAGRGNSDGGDRRSTSSNSNQQQHANCVGAASRGSKRGGGTNSGPSDEDAEDGPCSSVVKRRRRGSCSSPGGVSAENGSSSSVTSVSVSYSTLSRGSRARGALESTPQQHSSSVTPNRDNARTSSLEAPHSRPHHQQTPSKNAPHQQTQLPNTHHVVDDTTELSNKNRQELRLPQPAASPVTSEDSSYGAASSSSQLLPSQVIKVELDYDRGGADDGGEGGGEDEPRDDSGKLPKERMDNRGGNHVEESDGDLLMYNESLSIVKVEEDETEARSGQVGDAKNSGGAGSSKVEGESRPSTDWSGGEDSSTAPLGDETRESNTTKGAPLQSQLTLWDTLKDVHRGMPVGEHPFNGCTPFIHSVHRPEDLAYCNYGPSHTEGVGKRTWNGNEREEGQISDGGGAAVGLEQQCTTDHEKESEINYFASNSICQEQQNPQPPMKKSLDHQVLPLLGLTLTTPTRDVDLTPSRLGICNSQMECQVHIPSSISIKLIGPNNSNNFGSLNKCNSGLNNISTVDLHASDGAMTQLPSSSSYSSSATAFRIQPFGLPVAAVDCNSVVNFSKPAGKSVVEGSRRSEDSKSGTTFNGQLGPSSNPICTGSSNTKNLNRHPGGLARYFCEFCSKQFIDKSKWSRHLLAHTGEKPFVCHLCARPFSRKDNLQTHLKDKHRLFAAASVPRTMSSTASARDSSTGETGACGAEAVMGTAAAIPDPNNAVLDFTAIVSPMVHDQHHQHLVGAMTTPEMTS